MSPRRLAAGIAAPLLILGAAPAALADDVHNLLDGSIDATAELMPLDVGGAGRTTVLAVSPANGDGKNGCNLTGSTTLSLAISSSDTKVATVSPSSVTFTSCGDTKTLTVTPVGVGTATISARQTANTSGGSFDLAPAAFTVAVTEPAPTDTHPANTAPTLSIGGVAAAASYVKGSVPTATCVVADAEDGPSTYLAELSPVSGPYAADGIGTQEARCTYTDRQAGGGLTVTASLTYRIIDDTAPVIGYTLDPAVPDGDNGWWRGDIDLTWSVTEDESPSSLDVVGCEDQTITTDQVTDYSCSAASAGGAAAPVTTTLRRDGSAPSAPTVVASPAANTAGWNNSDVTVDFVEAGDVGPSGVAACTAPVLVDADTAGRTVEGTCTDRAGNTSAAAATVVKVDKTPPAAPAFSGLTGGASYDFGSVPAAPTCTSSDALSGLAGCSVTGWSAAVGSHTLTAIARDVAGNASTSTLSYTVLPYRWSGFYSPVDMGGVVNTVKAGSTVPLKFELFTSVAELTGTSAISSFTAREVSCTTYTGAPTDAVEITATGGTALRYDSTAGQFIQNWKTPTTAGRCYAVSVTTDDGQTRPAAVFKLK